MEQNQLVSIIIPAYNTEKYFSRMMECVIDQTYKNLQIIVVDDGSIDGTSEIAKKYADNDSRVEFYSQTNQGVSAARNHGLQNVRGEKIFFFDSDDSFEPDLVEKCLLYSKSNNVTSVLYGYADWIDGNIEKEHKFEIHGNYRGGGYR